MIKVLIVDDDLDSAKALKRNIDGQEDIKVVEILDNGIEAVERCLEIKPDLILMDVKMPEMDGIEACRLIKAKDAKIKVLILTFYQVKDNEVTAIKNGCDGYLYKGHKSEDIITIIKSTLSGFATYESGVKDTIHDQINYKIQNEAVSAEMNKLTDREIDIVCLITAGKKDSEISRELFISEGYIRNQLIVIREKLGLRNSKELAVWGAKAGL